MSEVQIDTLLKALNESNRHVFKYKVFYNLNYKEISRANGHNRSQCPQAI